jgi:hypothetical protein
VTLPSDYCQAQRRATSDVKAVPPGSQLPAVQRQAPAPSR